MSNMTLSHAIVRFINNKTDSISIIEILNIKEFKHEAPEDCYDFIPNHVYYGREHIKSSYTPISIFALGSDSELQDKIENEPTLMRKFKAHKFNTSDYEPLVNSSLDESSTSTSNKGKEDVNKNSDDYDSDVTDIFEDVPSAVSPSLITKTRKRLTKKSKNFKRIQDASSDAEYDSKEVDNEKVVEAINKKEQRATLKKKMETLVNFNNLEIPGISNTNVDYEKNELYERLKKLEEENKSLKENLQKENKSQKQSKLTKAKRHLLYEDEFENCEGNNSVGNNVPSLRNKIPKTTLADEPLSDSPKKNHENVDNKLQRFEKWTQIVNDQEIEMIHLGHGTSIQFIKWKECKKAKTISLFAKNLARALWGVNKLANRVLKESDNVQKLTDRESPRKVLSPQKVSLLEECVRFFLTKIKPSLVQTDIETEIGKIRSYLSDEVAYQFRKYKQNIKKRWSHKILNEYFQFILIKSMKRLNRQKRIFFYLLVYIFRVM